MKSFIEDWRGQWLSLGLAVAVLFAFSRGWQAPLFGYGEESGQSSIARNFYYPFYACGIALLVISYRQVFDAIWRTPLLLLLVMMCAASFFWSIDPSTTLRRFVALLFTVLCGYALATRFSWERLTEVVALTFVGLMVLTTFLAVAVPEMGRMSSLFPGAWRGPWMEKNNLGAVMAVGFTICAAAALHNPQRALIWWGGAAWAAMLVIMSTSKTSLVALLIGGAGIAFIALARRGPIIGIALTWMAVSALMIVGCVMLFMPDLVFGLLGKDATFTGRTNIWEGIDAAVARRPLLGWGYGVVWTTEGNWTPLELITRIAGFRPYHAHSDWYEQVLGLGMVGLVLWGAVFLEVWGKAFWRTAKGDGGYFALPFIGIYSLSGLTESLVLSYNDLRWLLFVMVLVKLSLRGDRDETAF